MIAGAIHQRSEETTLKTIKHLIGRLGTRLPWRRSCPLPPPAKK
jgi:hypothetical protein